MKESMPGIQATYQDRGEYLFASIRGQWTETSARRVIEEIKSEADKYNQSRVLVDLMDILPPDLPYTRFTTGIYAAQVWGSSLKVATVTRQEFITRFAENAAVNRGAKLRGFTDEKQALQWLLQP